MIIVAMIIVFQQRIYTNHPYFSTQRRANLVDRVAGSDELREEASHVVDENVNELGEKAQLASENLTTVANGASQDATKHVVTPICSGPGSIRDRKRQGSNVIGNHPVCHV